MAKSKTNELPSAIDVEARVLGSMLLNGEESTSRVAGILSASDFYAGYHALIFKAVVELWTSGVPIDIVTASGALQKIGKLERIGGEVALAELLTVASPVHQVEYHAKILKEKSIFRQAYRSLKPIVEKAMAGDGDPFELLNSAREAVHQADTIGQTGSSLIGRAVTQTRAILGTEGVKSGISTLDRLISYREAELILLAGRPSQGKTAAGLQICKHAMSVGLVPGMLSLEMSTPQLIIRLIASETGIDFQRILSYRLTEREQDIVEAKMRDIEALPFVIDDSAALSIVELQSRARQMQREHGISLLVVDYLQLLSGSNRESREKEVSSISKGLKQTAKTLRIPVIALSQLSRNSEYRQDKRPVLSDLRDSGSLEQDADAVIFVYNQDFISGNIRQEMEKAELIVAKQRNGPTGVADVYFHPQKMMFTSREEAHEEVNPTAKSNEHPPGKAVVQERIW